jgi:hypothetical protein
MSDEDSFAVTSNPVRAYLEKLHKEQKVLQVQVFPENVYKFKPNALNHRDVQEVSFDRQWYAYVDKKMIRLSTFIRHDIIRYLYTLFRQSTVSTQC